MCKNQINPSLSNRITDPTKPEQKNPLFKKRERSLIVLKKQEDRENNPISKKKDKERHITQKREYHSLLDNWWILMIHAS